MNKFLPITHEEMIERGWEQPDFVLVTGDAYVDHPSFGTAIISRVLEDAGYKVAILAQPDYKSTDDFKRFGRPRLGFLINSGNVDSMVNNYSVAKRKRKKDVYSTDGKAGKRPDRAIIVYANKAREAYKGVPVIIGGLEASLRRLGHYDYWDNKVRRSLLLDSKADILTYGMGEKAVVEVADALNNGFDVRDITWVDGTVVRADGPDDESIILPSFDELEDKRKYAISFKTQYENSESIAAKPLIEQYGTTYIRQNQPQAPLEEDELDRAYGLPYTYLGHPCFGDIPATREVSLSITMNRGCFGNCAFCALTYHQGRQVRSRSEESVYKEAKQITSRNDFKGYIHDVGGPTANFSVAACKKQLESGTCTHRSCYNCSNLEVDHTKYMNTLRTVRGIRGVKKAFVRSGIRFDYLMKDRKRSAILKELCSHHISGTLKVAPEHVSNNVLRLMNKPEIGVFNEFSDEYFKINDAIGMDQYLIPYFISSHPGSTLEDALELALYLKKSGFIPDQVQDFYPTPGTLATAMYYTGINPMTGETVYVARSKEEKEMQRALLHFHKPENRNLVERALKKLGRTDLQPYLLGGKNNEFGKKVKHNTRRGKAKVGGS